MRDEIDEVAVPCTGKLLGQHGMLYEVARAVNGARRRLMPAGSKAQWRTGTTCRYIGTRRGKAGKVELVYQVRRVAP